MCIGFAYPQINYYCQSNQHLNSTCFSPTYIEQYNELLFHNNLPFKEISFVILFYSDLNKENSIMPELLYDEYYKIHNKTSEYLNEYYYKYFNNYTEKLDDVFNEDYCFDNNSWIGKNNKIINMIDNYIFKDFLNDNTKNGYCINRNNKYYIKFKQFYTTNLNLFNIYVKDLISVIVTFIIGFSLGMYLVGNIFYAKMKTNKNYLYQEDPEQDEIEFYKYKYIEEYDELENIDITDKIYKIIEGKFIKEETPKGNIYMGYDKEKEGFIYYAKSASSFSYEYLDTVARKFIIKYNCKNLYHHLYDEMVRNYQIARETKLNDNIDDEADVGKGTGKDSVFMNVKSYNKTKNNKKLDKKSNKFIFKGTLYDYKENKSKNITSTEMHNQYDAQFNWILHPNSTIKEESEDEVKDEVEEEVKEEVEDEVKDEVEDEVDDKVEEEVKEEVDDKVEGESESFDEEVDASNEEVNTSKEEIGEEVDTSNEEVNTSNDIQNKKRKGKDKIKNNKKVSKKDNMNKLSSLGSAISFKEFKKNFIDKKNN